MSRFIVSRTRPVTPAFIRLLYPAWIRRGDPEWLDRSPGLPLSYLELVEAAFATHFRKMGVPFDTIRNARLYAAHHFHSDYPFAELQFKTDGYRVLIRDYIVEKELHSKPRRIEDYGVDAATLRIDFHSAGVSRQTPFPNPSAPDSGVWLDLIEEKSSEFDYDFGLALTWHPEGQKSEVTIDPRTSFGDPSVNGIPTWVIKGRWEAGETLDALGHDYGLPGKVIKDALRFEGADLSSDQ